MIELKHLIKLNYSEPVPIMPLTMFLISILCCHNGKLLGEKKKQQFCGQHFDVGLAAHGGIRVLYLFAKILARRVLGEGVANRRKTMCSVFDIFPLDNALFVTILQSEKSI